MLNLLPATPSIPLIPAFHTTPIPTRQTPLTARSQFLPKHLHSICRSICAATAETSAQHLSKHLRSTCRSICAAPAEAPAQHLPKHLRSNCRSICAAPAEAPAQQLPKHLRSTCRSTCAATAEAPAQHLPKHLRSSGEVPQEYALALQLVMQRDFLSLHIPSPPLPPLS